MTNAAAAFDSAAELSQEEVDMLSFEAANPGHSAAKAERIRRQFDCSATRYYQILATLIETPEAVAYDPVLIGRLRRMLARRQLEQFANRPRVL